MARTVVGYFRSVAQAEKVVKSLIEQGYEPDTINMTWDDVPADASKTGVDYDNTIEQAPMIAFKDALFGADITEEDAIYYNKLLNEGDVLVSVYVHSDGEDRDWEIKTARNAESALGKAGAYDHEVRKIYSNRAGLTTYPQNRYLDPVGPNKLNQDRIHGSRSALNGESSNVLSAAENVDFYDEIEKMGGRQIESGPEVLARLEGQATKGKGKK